MHEMSIVMGLVDIIKEEMERHGAKRLCSVRVKIGKLTAVVPEALNFCFDIITKGTPMEGAKIIMEFPPLKAYCIDCNKEFEIEEYVFRCPSCGSEKILTDGGRDLSIEELEVD